MVANIFVYDEIGKDTTLKSVRAQYNMYDSPSEVVVHINSVGGDVMEGYAIHDYLRSLGRRITTTIEGKCYSIATVIALAGDERLMTPNSELMIHNPWMDAGYGDAKHYKQVSDQLQKEESKLAEFYEKKTSIPRNEIIPMMDSETYMKLDQARSLGFITGESTQLKAVAKLNIMSEKEEKVNKVFSFLEGLFGNKKAMEDGEDEMKAMEMTLADGTRVFVDSEDGDFVGKQVFVVTDDGNVPAPDGIHELQDGRSINVEDGVITEVTEASSAEDTENKKDDEEEMNKMKEEMEALKAENAALKAQAEEAVQAKETEFAKAMKESDEKLNALYSTVKELKAMVITDEAPKPKNKTVVTKQAAKSHKFDNLIK